MSRSKSELEGLKMEDQEEEETEEEDLAHIIYVYMYIIRREIMGWGDLSQKAGGDRAQPNMLSFITPPAF